MGQESVLNGVWPMQNGNIDGVVRYPVLDVMGIGLQDLRGIMVSRKQI